MNNLENILSFNDKYKILVYGDLIIDIYNNVITKRISSECSIPVFEEAGIEYKTLGGAGNVLNNLLLFNKNTHLLSIVEEKYIDTLIPSINLININDNNYKNIIKTRYFSSNQQHFRVDTKNNYIMDKDTIDKFKKIITNIILNYDIIVISDYNTGIINEEIVTFIIDKANSLNIPTIIDPKNSYKIYQNGKIIKTNKQDAEKFSNKIINNIEDGYNICDDFLTKLNIQECIITLSEKGCIYKNKNNEKFYIECQKNQQFEILDVTGAGDTFISTYTIGILNKLKIEDNLFLCNLFCSDVIKRKYVSVVDILKILQKNFFIFNEKNCYILKKFLNNKKIIFTTGCFDLVHEGHIEVLRKAKELGNILIVALNDDKSIKNLKGDKRPINNLKTRINVLSSIKYIDFIITFSQDTPNDIYNIIQPNILVKGGDYSFEKIQKIFPNVENFISIPLIDNISTTNIIQKIIDL